MDHLMKHMNTISRCAILYREKQLEGSGLSGFQSAYAFQICKHRGITQDQLAQHLHVNPSTVTRQLAILEENEFITRQRSESDRRAIEVFPTQKMLDTLPKIRKVGKSWQNQLTAELTEEQRAQMNVLLKHLSQRAEELV